LVTSVAEILESRMCDTSNTRLRGKNNSKKKHDSTGRSGKNGRPLVGALDAARGGVKLSVKGRKKIEDFWRFQIMWAVLVPPLVISKSEQFKKESV